MKLGGKKNKLKRNIIIDNNDGTSTVIVNSKRHGLQHVQVSTEDVPLVRDHCWAIASTDPGRVYATTRQQKPDGKYTTLYMHKLIATPADDLVVDHVDHDSLNNTRSNLRCVPHFVNIHNLRVKPKGYSLRASGKYRATISVNARIIHLGTFNTPEEASQAYWAAKAAHGLLPPEV